MSDAHAHEITNKKFFTFFHFHIFLKQPRINNYPKKEEKYVFSMCLGLAYSLNAYNQ